MKERGISIRYSKAFKIKVIKEIEEKELKVAEAKRIYDIRGSVTIPNWLRKYGKEYLLPKQVRVEMPGEKDRIKQLEKEKREMQAAITKLTLQNQVYESMFEIYAEDNGYELKKNYGIEELKELMKKPPRKGKKQD